MTKIICAAYGYGAFKFGAHKGAQKMYEILTEQGLDTILLEPDCHPTDNSREDRILCASTFSKKLADTTAQFDKPIIIGGDHSIGNGSWSGIYKRLSEQKPDYKMGLIWIDAHMDSHTPETTETGTPHGMPLAALLGYGDQSMCEIGKSCAKVLPENLVLIGTRSYESGEEELLKRLNVNIIHIDDFKRDINAAIKSAVKTLTEKTDGFGISFDLDVLDPTCLPGTGCQEPNGMSVEEAFKILEELKKHKNKIIGLEMVEYFPELDKKDMSLKVYMDILKIYQSMLA